MNIHYHLKNKKAELKKAQNDVADLICDGVSPDEERCVILGENIKSLCDSIAELEIECACVSMKKRVDEQQIILDF